MTSKATSNYERILQLGLAMADTLAVKRPSSMLDWPSTDQVWGQLELRLKTLHGYDVLSGMQDGDVPVLLQNLRQRLHYWDVALRLGDYLGLLTGTSAERMLELGQRTAQEDQTTLIGKGMHYGDSWKRRGGVGAFMMLARKWDRLDNLLSTAGSGPQLHAALQRNPGQVQDDVHDLRRYLLLVEDEAMERNDRLDQSTTARGVALEQVLTAKLTPIPEYCTLYSASDFKRECRLGLFTDDDGSGYLATSEGYDENFPVQPSTMVDLLSTNYTHVVWFAK